KSNYQSCLLEIKSESSDKIWSDFAISQLRGLAQCSTFPDLVAVFEEKSPRFVKAKSPYSEETNEKFKLIRKKFKERFKNEPQMTLAVVETNKWIESLFLDFYPLFRKEKSKLGVLSVQDLETIGSEILANHEEVAKNFSKDWDYWMIDEYQDTSPKQVMILDKLADGRPQFIVGDPQQSIYIFRGARKEVFEDRENQLEEYQRELKLINYRSDPSLLCFINDLIRPLPGEFSPMEPKESPLEAKIVGEILISNDEESELISIVKKLRELSSDGVALKDICILANKNSELSKIARILREFAIPFQQHAAAGFMKRREVQDFLAYGRFLVNPFDQENLIHVLRTPIFRMSDQALLVIRNSKNKIWHELQKSDELAARELILFYNLSRDRGISYALGDVVKRMVSLSYIGDPSGRREANLWKIYSTLKQEEHRAGFSFLDFFDNNKSEMNVDSDDGEGDAISALEPNRVQLMTIHKSKGLEFPYVIVPFLSKPHKSLNRSSLIIENGIFSMGVADEEGESPRKSFMHYEVTDRVRRSEEEEHFRKFYVACTRAEKYLILTTQDQNRDGSWWNAIELKKSCGKHSSQNFSYVVRSEDWKAETTQSQRSTDSAVREQLKLNSMELQRVSVTSLLETGEAKEGQAPDSGDVIKRLGAVSRGTLVHSLLERAIYLKGEYRPLLEGLKNLDDREALERALEYTLSLNEPPMGELLKVGKSEWGFVNEKDGKLIEGQVDLWGVVDGTIWILDYKTGSERYLEKAFSQLEIYKESIEIFLKEKRPTKLAVVYPFSRKSFVR
ncbi:MAG: UvrD-helicase domain-containing protein, partial [Bdellovibrionales bacterium]|nr:UvrD-helicase domain-containing protein [Bdellovibrionales bacterium]